MSAQILARAIEQGVEDSCSDQLFRRLPPESAIGFVDERQRAVGKAAARQVGLHFDDDAIVFVDFAERAFGGSPPASLKDQRADQQDLCGENREPTDRIYVLYWLQNVGSLNITASSAFAATASAGSTRKARRGDASSAAESTVSDGVGNGSRRRRRGARQYAAHEHSQTYGADRHCHDGMQLLSVYPLIGNGPIRLEP